MTSRHVFAALLCSLVFVCLARANFNLWTPPDGVMIRQADHVFWTNDGAAQRADGSCGVVWSAATEGTQNIYIQAISPSGQPLWENPVQITSDPWAQNDAICLPFGDGWIVGWRDYRNGTDWQHPGEFYIQNVSAAGEIQWHPSGVHTGSGMWESEKMHLMPCNDSQFFAIWSTSYSTYVQKFDAAASSQFENPVLFFDRPSLGLLSDASTGLLGFTYDYDSYALYAYHLDESGTQLWGTDGVCVVPDPGSYNAYCQVASDGSGGAFVTWSFRVADGPSDVYAQHLDADGNIMWDDQMTIVGGGDGYQHTQTVFPAEPGKFFVMWLTGNWWGDDSEARIQLVTSTAEGAELEWGDDVEGQLLAQDVHIDIRQSTLQRDDLGGAYISWVGNTHYGNDSARLNLLNTDSNGTVIWQHGPMLESMYRRHGAEMVVQQDNLVLICHQESPNLSKVSASSFARATGNELDEEVLFAGYSDDIYDPLVIRDDDKAYMVWYDLRSMPLGIAPYMQSVDVMSGETQWQDHGIHLMPAMSDLQYQDGRFYVVDLQVMSDGVGNSFAAWSSVFDDGSNNDYVGHVQKIDTDGQLLWGDEGVLIEDPNRDMYIRKILPAVNGHVLVYSEFSLLYSISHLYYQRLDQNGNLMYPDRGIQLIEDLIELHDVKQLADGSLMLIYSRRIDEPEYGIYADLVDTQGTHLWDEPVLVIPQPSPYTNAYQVQVERVGDKYLVGIKASGGSSVNIIWMQMVDAEGNLLWPDDPFTFDCEPSVSHSFTIAPSDADHFWVGVREASYLRLDCFNLDKAPVTPMSIIVGDQDPVFEMPTLVTDDEGGVFVLWGGSDNELDVQLRYTHFNSWGGFADPAYASGPMYLSDACYQKEDLNVTADNEGGVLAVWRDFRGRLGEGSIREDVYAMRINETLTDVNPQPIEPPSQWELYPVYPNPFNPSTQVSFTLASQVDVKLAVFDVLGRHVTTLVNDVMTAGTHHTVWDGLNSNGSSVASGIYFVRMETPDVVLSRKAVLMK
jgi:FlgD Ig-like domain